MSTSDWAGNLTLSNMMTPHGFASLAAAVAQQLRKYGKAFLYLDDKDNVLHKDPEKEIALCSAPSLIVDPSAITDVDDDKGLITIRLDGVQVLKHSSLVLDDEPEELEEEFQ